MVKKSDSKSGKKTIKKILEWDSGGRRFKSACPDQ